MKSIYLAAISVIGLACCLTLLLPAVQAQTSTSAPTAQQSQAGSGAAPGAPAAQPRLRYRIAVDQGAWTDIHTNDWTIPPDVADGIQAQLVDKLQKSGYFVVMERQSLGQMNQEDSLNATKQASLPPGTTTGPARQERTPANYIITPSVIGFSMTSGKQGGVNFGFLNIGGGKEESTLTLNIRISDAQTSEVIDTQTAEGKVSKTVVGAGVNLPGSNFTYSQFDASPPGQATDRALDDAVSKIVARLSQEPWTALVAAQDPNTGRIIINAGSQCGVTAGMRFEVDKAGTPIYDPDSGDIISQGEPVEIGHIKVARVEEKAAYCDVVDGKGMARGDVVKVGQ